MAHHVPTSEESIAERGMVSTQPVYRMLTFLCCI